MTAKEAVESKWVHVLSTLLGMIVIMTTFAWGVTDKIVGQVDERMDKFEIQLIDIAKSGQSVADRVLVIETENNIISKVKKIIDGKK